MEQYYAVINSTSLTHHGIKGQKWGIRRYQNEDGTWTDAGQKRYGSKTEAKLDKYRNRLAKRALRYSKHYNRAANLANYDLQDLKNEGKNSYTYKSMVSDRRAREQEAYERDKNYSRSELDSALKDADRMVDLGRDLLRDRDAELQSFMNEKTSEIEDYKTKSSVWLARNKALMSLDISTLTSKKEIKNVYKNI